MPKYQASYTFFARIFDGGCGMDDPDPHKTTYEFDAKDEQEARDEAKKYMMSGPFVKNLIGVRSRSLDSLFKVEEVKLEKDIELEKLNLAEL